MNTDIQGMHTDQRKCLAKRFPVIPVSIPFDPVFIRVLNQPLKQALLQPMGIPL